MVKNTKGGSGHKGQARKHVVSSATTLKTRLSENHDLEQYAFIVKRLGGEFCHVMCHDGKLRLCVIRGKFRGGRGKRDSFINNDSWVLVGIREWETVNEKSEKLGKCDLLEVYKDQDKQKLKTVHGINWSLFTANDLILNNNLDGGGGGGGGGGEDCIEFTNNVCEEEYTQLMSDLSSSSSSSNKKQRTISHTTSSVSSTANCVLEEEVNMDEINIDDI